MGALSYKRFLSLFVLRSARWWWWRLVWHLKAINRKTECCPCCRGDVGRNRHAQSDCVRSKFGEQPASVFSGYRQTPERIDYYTTIFFEPYSVYKVSAWWGRTACWTAISSPKLLRWTFFFEVVLRAAGMCCWVTLGSLSFARIRRLRLQVHLAWRSVAKWRKGPLSFVV